MEFGMGSLEGVEVAVVSKERILVKQDKWPRLCQRRADVWLLAA